jgi:hypothetical protein
MKELLLQDLLNMADAPAHDSICDLWNQKTIHHLVVFTSADADFEIIGVGPTLPVATLDDAGRHSIPGKKPEFFVKCPAAISGKLLPKLAPAALAAHPNLARNPGRPAIMPTMKGRTLAPFMRPPVKLGLKAPDPAPTAPSPSISDPAPNSAVPSTIPAPAEPPAPTTMAAATTPTAEIIAPAPISANPPPPKSAPVSIPENLPLPNDAPVSAPANPPTPKTEPPSTGTANVEARERAIAERLAAITRREQELSAVAASLKIRETSLRERETAVATREENLLKPPAKAE